MIFAERILIAENAKTSLRAMRYASDSQYIYIVNQKDGVVRMACKVGEENQILYRYGKSKTMHWNDSCAKPNTDQEATGIQLLEGILAGYKECQNCWRRTKFLRGGGHSG